MIRLDPKCPATCDQFLADPIKMFPARMPRSKNENLFGIVTLRASGESAHMTCWDWTRARRPIPPIHEGSLILDFARKFDESFQIGDKIAFTISRIRESRIAFTIDDHADIPLLRRELHRYAVPVVAKAANSSARKVAS